MPGIYDLSQPLFNGQMYVSRHPWLERQVRIVESQSYGINCVLSALDSLYIARRELGLVCDMGDAALKGLT